MARRIRAVVRGGSLVSDNSYTTGQENACIECGKPILSSAIRVWWKGAWAHAECCSRPIMATPLGCVCPVGAEATCHGLSCPRRGFRMETAGA